MTSTNDRSAPARSALRTIAIAGLLTLMAGAGAGCDQRSQAAEALAQSQRELTTLGLADGLSASDARREKVYKDVIARLQPVAGEGNESQSGAASALLAQAHAGLGEIHTDRAVEAAGRAMAQVRLLGSLIDRRDGHVALVAAMSAYDPSSDAAALRSQLSERRTELSTAQARVGELAARIAGLEATLAEHTGAASSLRAEEGELRARSLDAEQGERLSVVERAVEKQRGADAAEGKATGVRAQIALVAPELAAARTVVERVEKQIKFLQDGEKQIKALQAADREQAQVNRGAADEAGQELARRAEELGTHFKEQVEPEFDAAFKSFAAALRAASSAKGAGPNDRTLAQLEKARIQQSLAGAHRSRAIVQSIRADVLGELARAQPSIGGAESFASGASEASAAAAVSYAAAAEAYAAAIEALGSAGGRGELSEKLERIVRDIEAVRSSLPGAPEGAAPGANEDEAPAPSDEPAMGEEDAPIDEGAPVGDEEAAPVEGEEQPATDEPAQPQDEAAREEAEPTPAPGDEEPRQ